MCEPLIDQLHFPLYPHKALNFFGILFSRWKIKLTNRRNAPRRRKRKQTENQEENVEWYRNRRSSLKRIKPSGDDGEIGKLPINCRCQSVFSRRKKSSLLRRVSNNARYNGDSIVDCASSTAIFLSSIICFSPTATMLSNESPCVLIYEITDFSTSHFARTIFHIIFQFTRVGIPLSLSGFLHLCYFRNSVDSFFLDKKVSSPGFTSYLIFSSVAVSKIERCFTQEMNMQPLSIQAYVMLRCVLVIDLVGILTTRFRRKNILQISHTGLDTEYLFNYFKFHCIDGVGTIG